MGKWPGKKDTLGWPKSSFGFFYKILHFLVNPVIYMVYRDTCWQKIRCVCLDNKIWHTLFRMQNWGNTLAAQWLGLSAFTAVVPGSIPGWGLRSLLAGTDPDAGKDWEQEDKGLTEDWGQEDSDRGWDSWMASLTQWIRFWANSGRYWRAGKPGVLQSMGSQRVGHDWATEQQQSHEEQSKKKRKKNWSTIDGPWTSSRRTNIYAQRYLNVRLPNKDYENKQRFFLKILPVLSLYCGAQASLVETHGLSYSGVCGILALWPGTEPTCLPPGKYRNWRFWKVSYECCTTEHKLHEGWGGICFLHQFLTFGLHTESAQ